MQQQHQQSSRQPNPAGNPGRMGATRLRGEVRHVAAQHKLTGLSGYTGVRAQPHEVVTRLSYELDDLFHPERIVWRTSGLQVAGKLPPRAWLPPELLPPQMLPPEMHFPPAPFLTWADDCQNARLCHTLGAS